MAFTGINSTLLMGSTQGLPVPPEITDAVESIEVTHSDQGRSGFQIIFKAERSGLKSVADYPLLRHPLLKVGNRTTILVSFNYQLQMIMDGLITHIQLNPAANSDTGIITVTGEDVSIAMDQEEKILEHPAQNELVIANKIIASYAKYGLVPVVIPPKVLDIPNPTERIPVQYGTDVNYLKELAELHGYVFYVSTGPIPLLNRAYWGPPKRLGLPQRALSVNMGPYTNVEGIDFQYDGQAAISVSGKIRDTKLGQTFPIETFTSTRLPLSQNAISPPLERKTIAKNIGCLNYSRAQGKAQADMDKSRDKVIIAKGTLDTCRYGGILQARSSVGVRGVGASYDGLYYVQSVNHNLSRGEYKQQFTLQRDGLGTSVPGVLP